MKSLIIVIGLLFITSSYAVTDFEVFVLGMEPGHGQNSSDFESQTVKHNAINSLLNPTTKINKESSEQITPFQNFNTRSAYSMEYFNVGTNLTAMSHTIKGYAETQVSRDHVVGGNLYVNTVNSEAFAEGVMLNNNIGLFGRHYIEDLTLQISYNSLFFDSAVEFLVGGTWGHNISFSTAHVTQMSDKIMFNYGASLDYFIIGDAMNSKMIIAGQSKYILSKQITLGVNSIFNKMLFFNYDSGSGSSSSLGDLNQSSQFMLGLLCDYALSSSFALNLSLDQTLNIDNHNNFVFGIGSEFGF